MVSPHENTASVLTPHALKMLNALREIDGWVPRKTLARLLQRSRLYDHDADMLNALVAAGLVEVQQRAVTGHLSQYFYRAVRKGE